MTAMISYMQRNYVHWLLLSCIRGLYRQKMPLGFSILERKDESLVGRI